MWTATLVVLLICGILIAWLGNELTKEIGSNSGYILVVTGLAITVITAGRLNYDIYTAPRRNAQIAERLERNKTNIEQQLKANGFSKIYSNPNFSVYQINNACVIVTSTPRSDKLAINLEFPDKVEQ